MTNKSTIILLLLSFFILTGCGDDDSDPVLDNNLIGTWNMNNISYSGTSTTSYPGIPDVTATFTGESTESDYQIVFNEDNTYSTSGSYTINLTTEVGGQSDTQSSTVSGAQALGSGTWQLSGNTLSITSGGQTTEGTLTELTANNFRLETNLTQTQSFSGTSGTITVDAVFNASR